MLGNVLPLQQHLPILVIKGLAADVIEGNDQLQHFEGVSAKYNHIQYVSDMTGKVVCLPLNPRKRPLLSFSVFLTRTTKTQPGGEFVGCVGQIDKWDRNDVCDLAGRESREVCCIVESVHQSGQHAVG